MPEDSETTLGVRALEKIGPVLVGSRGCHCEADQALLLDAVDRRELAALCDVLTVTGHRPGGLRLPGDGADGQCRVPLQQ